jgi:predicted nucleotide-binding protein
VTEGCSRRQAAAASWNAAGNLYPVVELLLKSEFSNDSDEMTMDRDKAAAELEKFREAISKYRQLLIASRDPLGFETVDNREIVDKERSSLIRVYAALEYYIAEFGGSPRTSDGVWNVTYSPYENAFTPDTLARVRPSLDLVLIDLDLAIGRIRNVSDDEFGRRMIRPADAATLGVAKREGKVFVVHGRDEAALQELARFLEKVGLIAVVLREQPDQGRTVIEKFESCANEVEFAVVLLTPDDLGGLATAGDQAARARQNVVFELGFFAGKLGRGKVCLLKKGTVEIPSDLYGVIYTELDHGGGWKLLLGREIKAAGLTFDVTQLLD